MKHPVLCDTSIRIEEHVLPGLHEVYTNVLARPAIADHQPNSDTLLLGASLSEQEEGMTVIKEKIVKRQ